MKSKNYILSVLAIGLMTGSMVSCSDFLDYETIDICR